ncbi:hypothetical protein RJT34_26742 [Clitoria ternatea]|uniref:Uncharacterized protein n=1 Tax=Clitoria ternatea TaxID=43366 RepID=A0AAN9F7K0_CLITE
MATSTSLCLGNHHCLELAKMLMSSNVRETASTTLGLISVFVWIVAEIPQIITNYRRKSTEGLAVAFLLTWLIGDIFNLFGCLLEPATVSVSLASDFSYPGLACSQFPSSWCMDISHAYRVRYKLSVLQFEHVLILRTQLYTAVLYFIITVSLCSQAIYYGYIYPRLKCNRQLKIEMPTNVGQSKSGLEKANDVDRSIKFDDFKTAIGLSSPIPLPARRLYYQ